MTKDKVIEILKNEANCVKAAEYCTRECNKCSLVRNANDILLQFGVFPKAKPFCKGICNVIL